MLHPVLAGATRKVAWRIVPFLCLLYMFNILDRANVGFARIGMTKDLGLTDAIIDWGYGLFYVGYLVFEVPSNLLLRKFGARVWISRIMITWGLVSMLTLAVAGPVSYYWARVLLGIAEAGFFPGIIFYLTAWFPAAQRARVVAWFMLAIPVANILGNPVSGLIMDTFKGTAGMAGWQWLFLLEGLPSVALGVLVLFVLPDRPRDAHWLNENEKAALENQIEQEDDQRRAAGGTDKLGAMADPRVWLLVGLYFSVAVGTNATGAYLPKLVKGHFEPLLQEQAVAAGRDKEQILWQVGLLAALPHLASVGAMLLTSWLSDRWRVRSLLVAAALMVAGAGWALAWGMENERMLAEGQSLMPGAGWALAWGMESPWIAMGGLCLAQAGMMAVLPVFWALPPLFLGGAAAAAGIALINSVANIGGIFAPRIVGAWGVGPMVAFMVWGTIAAALARVVVEKKQVATSNKEVTDA